jgi:hypothetical protein
MAPVLHPGEKGREEALLVTNLVGENTSNVLHI